MQHFQFIYVDNSVYGMSYDTLIYNIKNAHSVHFLLPVHIINGFISEILIQLWEKFKFKLKFIVTNIVGRYLPTIFHIPLVQVVYSNNETIKKNGSREN